MTKADPKPWVLPGIVALAFILRVVGLSFGLPNIYHQDEPVIVNHAMAIGERGLNPYFFVIPSFTIYALFGLYAATFAGMKLLGMVSGKTDFAVLFLRDPSVFYLEGRFFLGVLFGTLTVYAVGRLAGKYLNKQIGQMAALFLSLSLLHAQHSHYIYADIPVTFFTTLLLFQTIRTMRESTRKNFALSGTLLGIASATKYTAAYFAAPMLILYFLKFRRAALDIKFLKKSAAAVLCAVAAYLLIAPYTLLDWPNFLKQMREQTGSESLQGPAYHFFHSLLNGTSLPFVALGLYGASEFWKKRKSDCAAFGLFAGFFYIINSLFGQPFSRYMMPVIPMLCVFAAFGVSGLERFVKNRAAGALALFVVMLSLAAPTLYADFLFLRKDTRDICLGWVTTHVKAGSVVVVDNRYFAPHLFETAEQLKEKYSFVSGSDSTKKKRLDLMGQALAGVQTYRVYTLMRDPKQGENAYLFQRPFVDMNWSALKTIDADYLILNYSEYNQDIQDFKQSMAPHLELAAAFSPFFDTTRKLMIDRYSGTSAPDSQADLFSRERLGPYLEVYKIKR